MLVLRQLRRYCSTNNNSNNVIYTGPLANVAKKLKLFSITSLGLGTGISPFVFLIDVPVPWGAKAALVGAAIATSAASTGLIQWVMSPYVTKITRSPADKDQLTFHTLSLLAREHQTTVSVQHLQPATRIFTSLMVNDPAKATGRIAGKSAKPKLLFYVHPELCQEEGSEIKSIIDRTGIGKGF